ncbi:MAG: glycoside hydrolase family 57 protein [Bacteroidota bacterium]|nr:glycoside hydrolase family 57 protein [Bacteroidota bacterium]
MAKKKAQSKKSSNKKISNKKQISLYFQVHQPYRLKRYRFFDISEDSMYFDDFTNKTIIKRVAKDCYLPANELIKKLIKQHGDKFKVTFSITGTVLEQFADYVPEVINSFQELAKTGNVEFLAETYSHSLISLQGKEEFKKQVKDHAELIEKLFGQKPTVFRNTELIYNNEIGESIAEMGYEAMITEGAKHLLGWKSSNMLYYNVLNPELKLMLRNYELSDDIAFRFSNKGWDQWPLSVETYASWLNETDDKERFVNLFMDYETFGEHQKSETGIFKFLKKLPEAVLNNTDFEFAKASEVARANQPVAPMNVPHSISWADQERDITAWLGNEMQKEALEKLYKLGPKMDHIENVTLLENWRRLQASDHFYYMSTKISSDGIVHDYFNPYESPFDAFINYMNVISDFTLRVEKEYNRIIPKDTETIISEIEKLLNRIKILKDQLGGPNYLEKTKKEHTAISKTIKELKKIVGTKPELKALKGKDEY